MISLTSWSGQLQFFNFTLQQLHSTPDRTVTDTHTEFYVSHIICVNAWNSVAMFKLLKLRGDSTIWITENMNTNEFQFHTHTLPTCTCISNITSIYKVYMCATQKKKKKHKLAKKSVRSVFISDHDSKYTGKIDIKLRWTKTLYKQTPLPTAANVVTSLYSIPQKKQG